MSSSTKLAKKNKKSQALSAQEKINFLKHMLTSREGDLREQRLIRQGKGWFHISGMGHEATGIAATCLNSDDYCFPFYRDRAFCLARGITNYDIALSFFAKKESSSAGKQLPGHYNNRKLNIWSLLSPIASHFLPAAGVAWGLQLDQKPNVVFASVGDAGSRQGDFYEAIGFALEKKLPMVFMVEDNGVAISTKTEHTTALAVGLLPKDSWVRIDGTNVNEVYETTRLGVEKARNGEGPFFIWSRVERLSSHSSADDHRNYRSEVELTELLEKDPIVQFKNELIRDGILTAAKIEEIENEIREAVRVDYQKAEEAKDPNPGEETEEIFGEMKTGGVPDLVPGKSYRMADAVNLTFREILKNNKDAYFFGEDVEDPLGGVFKLTKGLSTDFPGKVVNSPLAESTIVGIACGLASYGKRPIFEIQFIDFITPGWNQLVNNLANLRWRSHGSWKCPAIIYAPCGAYLPGGAIWHSQTMESAFASFPGLYIVVPSRPEDAAGLLKSAVACEDPVLFLLPKHLLWVPRETPPTLEAIPLGKGIIRKTGNAVTVVTWGNGTEIVEKTLESLGNLSETIEYIDLRSIVPWDKALLKESVQKTGRLIVLQEDTENCSVGQMIISTLLTDEEVYSKVVAPPVLISKGNVHVGFNPAYEYSCLPSTQKLANAIHKTLAIEVKHETSTCSERHFVAEVAADEPAHGVGIQTIELPHLGEGLLEARVVEIFKQPGDAIRQDDPLCEVETDKAVFPVESPIDGVLKEWLVEKNQMIKVGQPIVDVSGSTTKVKKVLHEATHAPSVEMPSKTTKAENQLTEKGALSSSILKQLQDIVPASLSVTGDWQGLRELMSKLKRQKSMGVFSYTTLVAWCVVKALKQTPQFCRLLNNGKISEPQENFDIGFAVALENDELETAVIANVNQLSWIEFANAYRESLKKVRDRVPQSKARAPILLTSMGPLKMRSGYPIVVPPAMATLFLGEPYYESFLSKEGKVEVKEVVMLDLSFDHRWANGAGAGQFLKRIKENIETLKETDLV